MTTRQIKPIAKMAIITISIPILQAIFSALLITPTTTATPHISHISIQREGRSYKIRLSIEQTGQPSEMEGTIAIKTDNYEGHAWKGQSTQQVDFKTAPQKTTYYTFRTRGIPTDIRLLSYKPAANQEFQFLTPPNVLLVSTFATFAITLMIIVSMPDYRESLKLSMPPARTYVGTGIMVIGLKIALIAAMLAILPFFDMQKPANANDKITQFINEATVTDTPVTFFCVVIAAPLIEELLFRGYMLGQLLKTHKPRTAITASALLFAMVHFGPISMVNALSIGAVFGYAFYKTKSLLPCITLHFLNNILVLATIHASNSTRPPTPDAEPVKLMGSYPSLIFIAGAAIFFAIAYFVTVKGARMLAAKGKRDHKHALMTKGTS